MSSLKEKVALVTGAGGGLGRATALALAQDGARVGITDLNGPALEETGALLRAGGFEFVAVRGDIVESDTSAQLVRSAEQQFGRIDAVCNVAGVLGGGAIEQTTVAEFNRVMHVNCLAQVLLIQQALPALRRSPAPSIVNVASVGALVALPLMSLYCASKSAVLGLTRACAAELAPHIRCNAICPGGIESPMSDGFLAQFAAEERAAMLQKLTGRQLLKRFAQPAEIANLVVFLVSDASSFVTGAVLPIEGGHSAW